MALNKTVKFVITIQDNGVIEFLRHTIVDEDGEEVGTSNKRKTYEPGDDMSAEPAKLKAIANLIWTPAVIAAYKSWKDARIADATNGS